MNFLVVNDILMCSHGMARMFTYWRSCQFTDIHGQRKNKQIKYKPNTSISHFVLISKMYEGAILL